MIDFFFCGQNIPMIDKTMTIYVRWIHIYVFFLFFKIQLYVFHNDIYIFLVKIWFPNDIDRVEIIMPSVDETSCEARRQRGNVQHRHMFSNL